MLVVFVVLGEAPRFIVLLPKEVVGMVVDDDVVADNEGMVVDNGDVVALREFNEACCC